jgi:hypothetical protein
VGLSSQESGSGPTYIRDLSGSSLFVTLSQSVTWHKRISFVIRPSSANGGFSREQMPPVDMNRKMNFRLIFFMRGSPKKDAGDTWPFSPTKKA